MEGAGEVSAAAGNANANANGNGIGSARRPSTAPSARVSIWESVRACGVWGKEVDKAELRRQVVMPLHLRRAVAAAVAAKDEAAGVAAAAAASAVEEEEGEKEEGPTVAPVVVFVNSKSGGRHGPELKVRLHELITEEQVGVVTASRFAPRALVQPLALLLPEFCPRFLLSYRIWGVLLCRSLRFD
jgi:diacylglycerol kinase (ATP)